MCSLLFSLDSVKKGNPYFGRDFLPSIYLKEKEISLSSPFKSVYKFLTKIIDTDKNYTPLQARALFNDTWVFFLYSFCASFAVNSYVKANADVDAIMKVLMEPFSIWAFLSLSFCGFILITISYLFMDWRLKYTSKQIRNHCLIKNFIAPISEVGLSTGSIIIGASLGIFVYFRCFSDSLELINLANAAGTLAIICIYYYWPIFWFQKTLLANSKTENKVFQVLGILYILTFIISVFIIDKGVFIKMIMFTVSLCLVLCVALIYIRLKRNSKDQSK
jgi:hypothetical protein